MDDPTAYRNLRGPSPFVLAMRTRLSPPPLSDPPPLPAFVPPSLLQPEKRRRGRPRNCDRLPPPPGFFASPPAPPQAPTLPAPRPPLLAHGQGQFFSGLQPHMLQIDAGEEIIPKITALSKINGRVICVLSVLGAVQEATLLLSSGATSYHKGPLEIIRLFGSILTPNDQGCLRVTLASANSSVIGGIITGPLKAATPVQAVVASFYSDAYWPNRAPKIIALPNSQCTIRNGSTLSSEFVNPGYASFTAVDQNESSEVDIKPSLGVLNLASVDQNESSEVDVKPSLGLLNLASVDQNESSEVDIKPSLGVLNLASVDQNESSEVDVKPSLGLLNLASVDHNESSEVDVKPSLGLLNLASL